MGLLNIDLARDADEVRFFAPKQAGQTTWLARAGPGEVRSSVKAERLD